VTFLGVRLRSAVSGRRRGGFRLAQTEPNRARLLSPWNSGKVGHARVAVSPSSECAAAAEVTSRSPKPTRRQSVGSRYPEALRIRSRTASSALFAASTQ